MSIRLQKYIRDCSGLSRRKAEEFIDNESVTINGVVAKLGDKVNPDMDIVLLHGKPIQLVAHEFQYIMLYKPKGYITTRTDPEGRPTVYELLPQKFRHLFPVGRLDYNTEGLLLLTNDGDFSYQLTHPKFEIEKEYLVIINGYLSETQKKEIERGLMSDDLKTSPAHVYIKAQVDNKTSLFITIHEGQNREVRRIFDYFGFRVLHLKRVRIQQLLLKNLQIGQWQEIRPEMVIPSFYKK